ncbi:MAG: hypothetical protein JW715_16760 [Sedimentisphaerales bacterium]|nr:hypothetical protein [Sedimentisphaerales bacterium]
MKSDEKEFEDFLHGIEFDDTPDYAHRDKLEQNLHACLIRQKKTSLSIWRKIMSSRITKLIATAAVLIVVVLFGWLYSNTTGHISSFTLLARASAAEKTLFIGQEGIVHIVNEIIMYPQSQSDAGALLDELEADATQEKNVAFIKSWLSYQWLPVYSLDADGQLREHKLEVARSTDTTITISDISWYDPVTGCFARVLKTGDNVLFANSYDGRFVYIAGKEPSGSLKIEQQAETEEFRIPENPADFLGIAAGIKATVPGKHYPPIKEVTSERLEDGTPVRTYKLGFTDAWGKTDSYFLFKVDSDTEIIDEVECVFEGETTRLHRRTVTETVDNPELSWNMAEIKASVAEQTAVDVDTGEGADTVTVGQMVQRATYPVYIFAKIPSWTNKCLIYDLPDEASAPARMFCVTYSAKDSRDVVLNLGETFNRYFTTAFGKLQELGETIPWMYESDNGFKVLHQNDKTTEMWWTELALKSSGFEPHNNRVGYILRSPAGSYLVLAVNGPLSEQELHDLIDSLIPAQEYVPGSVEP